MWNKLPGQSRRVFALLRLLPCSSLLEQRSIIMYSQVSAATSSSTSRGWQRPSPAVKTVKEQGFEGLPGLVSRLIASKSLTPEIAHEVLLRLGNPNNPLPAADRADLVNTVLDYMCATFPVVGHGDDSAAQTLQASRSPFLKEETFSVAIEVMGRCKRAGGPQACVSRLIAKSVWPSVFTINALLAAYRHQEDYLSVLRTANNMFELGLEPHASTYAELLRCVQPAGGISPHDFISFAHRYSTLQEDSRNTRDSIRWRRVMPDAIRVMCLQASLVGQSNSDRSRLSAYTRRMLPLLREDQHILNVFKHAQSLVKHVC